MLGDCKGIGDCKGLGDCNGHGDCSGLGDCKGLGGSNGGCCSAAVAVGEPLADESSEHSCRLPFNEVSGSRCSVRQKFPVGILFVTFAVFPCPFFDLSADGPRHP